MSKIYYYKMTVDSGGAPCVDNGLLTLAICKPSLRSTCEERNLVLGFGSKAMGESLIYAAAITAKLPGEAYYSSSDYAPRGDCIYRWDETGPARRAGAKFHSEPWFLEHDLGNAPGYARASVLVSDDFRYFGGSKKADSIKHHFHHMEQAVEGLRQGHRVNHPDELRRELLEFKDALWEQFPASVIGSPTHPEDCGPCHEVEHGEVRSC